MSSAKHIRDFRKYPSFYFEESRDDRIQAMDKIIRRIDKADQWLVVEDPREFPYPLMSKCPLTNIKIIESGHCYEGETWSPKILQSEGDIPPLDQRVPHRFVMRSFAYTPVLDLDTSDLRHIELLKGNQFALSLGDGLNQILETQSEIRTMLPKSSWRIYMTTRGLRCVELGVQTTPSKYFRALSSTRSYDSGISKWDKAVEPSSMAANRLFAAVFPKGDSEGDKDKTVPLYPPPMFHCFVDRPDVALWINAMPILEVSGHRCPDAVEKVSKFHDDRVLSTMNDERWSFAWSELRRRMGSVQGEIRTAIEKFVGEYYKESKL